MKQSVDHRKSARADLWKAIGPGVLVACAAIGGSHLVWSTRAGADYGWKLVGLILIANLLKYPFFLYGQTYTAATGESLLAGYRRQGRFYLVLFMLINILTGVINIAGVAMVSGALLGGFGLFPGGITELTIVILIACGLVILLGHYSALDGLAKIVIIALAISTFTAVFLAVLKGAATPDFVGPSPWRWESFAFIVFLLGWMPAPIDLSAWASLWMFSRSKQTGHFATSRETAVDFYLGYVMAVVLAVAFLALGKLVMFGTGESFSDSGIAFSNQLVGLYAGSIGIWSRPLILTAAFVTMFSTTLTCVDGYPRALAACCNLLNLRMEFRRLHQVWIGLSVIAAILIVKFFAKNLIHHLSFAAAVAFVTSPILAAINFRVMFDDVVPKEARPGWLLILLSWAGLAFFSMMSLAYIYVQFYRS